MVKVLLLSVVTWSLESSVVSQFLGMGKTGEMRVGEGHPVPTVVCPTRQLSPSLTGTDDSDSDPGLPVHCYFQRPSLWIKGMFIL